MTGFDFSALNSAQRRLLDFGGWTVDPGKSDGRPPRRDAAALIERGLLIAVSVRRRDSYGSYSLTEYRVPDPARRAWLLHKEASA